MKLKFNFNKRNKYKISKCGNYAYANINNKNVALHRIITNTINELDKIRNPIDHMYLCYGLLCNIVVLKVIKDEEK